MGLQPRCRTPRPPSGDSGASLVELVAVAAIVALAAGLSAPSLHALIASVRVSAAANDLLADLLLARSEAIKRNTRVVLCKSSDGQVCAAAGGWQQGWIVFVDLDGNGMRATGEPLVVRQNARAASLRLTGNANVASYVGYVGTGSTRLTSGGFQAGTLSVCQASMQATSARQIVINATGRPRVQKAVMDNCP